MNKAVFLDRDGVINDGSLYYTYKVEDFVINEGVFNGLKVLKNAGFTLIVITNQGGIAKGIYTIEDVTKVHDFMSDTLEKQGITLDGIYFCPHHSDISACECRKPGTLMIEKAITKYNIDRTISYMIGDNEKDIVAASKAGLKPIKIDKNENIEPWCIKIAEGTL
jgi:D-glycero-D-manno-heptose 1,7-bisphosphate phosphatase